MNGYCEGLTQDDIREFDRVGLGKISEVFTEIVVNGFCVGLVYFDEKDNHTHITIYDQEAINGLSVITRSKLQVRKPEGIRQYEKVVK